jgi:DNA-binding NarL/FixJ family response regulator
MTRLVLVDARGLAREGLRGLLEAGGLEVVGEADDEPTAISLVRHRAPDVVVIDVDLPRIPGIETVRRMQLDAPATRVLVFAAAADPGRVFDAILAGACGYLLRDAGIEELSAGIEAAARGKVVLSPRAAAALVERLRAEHPGGSRAGRRPALTGREREVLALITAGSGNAEIARRLEIDVSTVKNHVSRILAKLDVDNRTQAAVRAVREQLI